MFFKRLSRRKKKDKDNKKKRRREEKEEDKEEEDVDNDSHEEEEEGTDQDIEEPFAVTPREGNDVMADIAEFWYDTGKRYVLGKEAGMEVAKNMGRGIDCIRRAADLGHAAAQWDLQCIVGEGENMRLDFELAVKIYKDNEKQNHPMALSNLGVCYHKGRGVQKDVPKSIKMYQRAVKQHYARGTYNLAVCYDLGEGVPANVPQAVELYLQSAKGGYAVAQYYMAVCYYNGKGLPAPDYDKAVEMWQRAADQGHAFSQYSLGQCYRDGRVVPKDLVKAARYFIGFSQSGDPSGWISLIDLLYLNYKNFEESENQQQQENEKEKKQIFFFFERETKVDETFLVPSLYDQLCLDFHKKWEKESVEGRKEEQDKLPAEVRDRVKYRATHCVRASCDNFYYGSGRVQRRYVLRKDVGGTEEWNDDVVLSFCSVECARFQTRAAVHHPHKAFDVN